MGQVVTEKSTQAKRIAYEVLAEFYPDPWTPAEVTDEVVEAAYTQVKELYRMEVRGRRKTGQISGGAPWLKRAIRGWLENPEREDWFVDEVAVDRAVALDWEAYRNLTHIEADVVRERLSRMADPWGVGADVFSPFMSDRVVSSGQSGSIVKTLTPRAEAWSRWPQKDARALRDAVAMRRARRAGAASAVAA